MQKEIKAKNNNNSGPVTAVRCILTYTVLLLLAAGCKDSAADRHPLWQRAAAAEAAGDYPLAEEIYSRLARILPEDIAVRIKLAEINDEYLNDPFRAAEAYAAILQIAPEHPEADIYRRLLRRARREACNIWLLDGSIPPPEAALPGSGLDPVRELQLLRRENAILRYELRSGQPSAQPQPASAPSAAATAVPESPQPEQAAIITETPQPEPAQQEPSSRERYYTVAAGDTPEKISRKLYGTSRYASAILELNKDTVRSARELQIGQRLRLPDITEQ